MKTIISTDKAPKAIGPYSQAIRYKDMVFVSGQIPVNPQTGEIVKGGIAEQVEQVMNNINGILLSAGLNFSNILKCTCFLKDLEDFKDMNEVYSKYFNELPPARVTVEVSRLPKDVLVEIDVIAGI